jgi:hypothetical protein
MVQLKRAMALPLESRQWAERAAETYPHHPLLLLDQAELALAFNSPQEALTLAETASTYCPTLADAPALIARARKALKKRN